MCIFSFVPDILIFEMSLNFILFFPMIFFRYHVENVFFKKLMEVSMLSTTLSHGIYQNRDPRSAPHHAGLYWSCWKIRQFSKSPKTLKSLDLYIVCSSR
jgi:hypothetical protein